MSERPPGTPIGILLVEDSLADARLTIEALRESKVANRIDHVKDGVEALAYLRREGTFAGANRPDLILLDLNLPRKDGREVLADVKGDPELRRIPIVVMTTSSSEADVLRAYDLHANAYVTKPVDLDEFFRVVRSIEEFWLAIVRHPGV